MKYLPCILLAILTIAFTSCNNDENSVLEESIAGGFDYLYSDDEDYDGSIVITKDNNSVLEGTFSIDAYSDFGDTETVNTMSGSFSIEK